MTLFTAGFTGSPLDRLEPVRTDADATAAMLADPALRVLALDGYEPQVEGGRLGWRTASDAAPGTVLALLGAIDGVPRAALIDDAAAPARRTPELMALLATLDEGEAATYATARSLLDWHARHRFCAFCGHVSLPHRAGWARRCPHCGTEHYPRVDPVVIMLAEHGEGAQARVLVGRSAAYPPGRYSALAGFVEVGESMEEAVRRELWEEAGVRAGAVRFLGSQPWPFPSQLMLAAIARVADDTLAVNGDELEDAIWVTREEVSAALAGTDGACFVPPPPYAIAHSLLRAWVETKAT